MVKRGKAVGALVGLVMAPLGILAGKAHLVAPSPGMFFALGVLATLSVAGIAYGFWEARRIVRSETRIGD